MDDSLVEEDGREEPDSLAGLQATDRPCKLTDISKTLSAHFTTHQLKRKEGGEKKREGDGEGEEEGERVMMRKNGGGGSKCRATFSHILEKFGKTKMEVIPLYPHNTKMVLRMVK